MTAKAIAATVALMAATVKGVDMDKLTTAVGQIESGMDHAAVGDNARALGAWQMHSAAWHDANTWRKAKGLKPYARSNWRNPVISRTMAKSYLEFIAARLSKYGHRVTPETIYLAYTVGITAYLRDGIEAASPAKVEASNRVGNLYRRK